MKIIKKKIVFIKTEKDYTNFLERMEKYAIVGTLSVPVNLQEQAENL